MSTCLEVGTDPHALALRLTAMARAVTSGVGRKNEVVERGIWIACDPPAQRYPLASGYSFIPPRVATDIMHLMYTGLDMGPHNPHYLREPARPCLAQ
jgi:hypothetical protein